MCDTEYNTMRLALYREYQDQYGHSPDMRMCNRINTYVRNTLDRKYGKPKRFAMEFGTEEVDSDAEILARRTRRQRQVPTVEGMKYKVQIKKTGLPHPHPDTESVMVPVGDSDGPATFHLKPTPAEMAKAARGAQAYVDKVNRNRMHNIPNLDMGRPGNTMFNLKEYL